MDAASSHIYRGSRLLEQVVDGPPQVINHVTVDDRPLPQTEPWSRYGLESFTWGFQSVGTEALAHAILAHELGEELADCYFGDFAAQVVALLPLEIPGETWSLSGEQVRAWLARQARGARSEE
jgi:hypothetical protein